MAGFVRLIIWGAAVFVASWPAMELSNAGYSFDIRAMGSAVQSAGHFKDFFYISIVISIIGLSNIFDNIATSRRTGHTIGDLSFITFSLLAITLLATLFYSLPHFVHIVQTQTPLDQATINRDFDIIRNCILAGIATELVIALRERPDQLAVSS
jgi:hypothetical protein